MDDGGPPAVLEYALRDYPSRNTEIRCSSFFNISLALAATPMSAGVLTTLLWVVEGWRVLILIGLCTIAGGMMAFALGFICLMVYFGINWRLEGELRRKVNYRALSAFVFLIANFPAAVLCYYVAENARSI